MSISIIIYISGNVFSICIAGNIRIILECIEKDFSEVCLGERDVSYRNLIAPGLSESYHGKHSAPLIESIFIVVVKSCLEIFYMSYRRGNCVRRICSGAGIYNVVGNFRQCTISVNFNPAEILSGSVKIKIPSAGRKKYILYSHSYSAPPFAKHISNALLI